MTFLVSHNYISLMEFVFGQLLFPYQESQDAVR